MTIKQGKEFYSARNIMWNSIDLHIIDRTRPKGVASEIIYKVVEPGVAYEPVLRLQPEEAEQLMTELWNAGVRPLNIQNLSGELSAVKYHLEDMRKLALNETNS